MINFIKQNIKCSFFFKYFFSLFLTTFSFYFFITNIYFFNFLKITRHIFIFFLINFIRSHVICVNEFWFLNWNLWDLFFLLNMYNKNIHYVVKNAHTQNNLCFEQNENQPCATNVCCQLNNVELFRLHLRHLCC